jgi:large subunit ribosomal protein L30
MLRIKLVKSPIGNNVRNRATVTALGLRRLNQVVEQEDTPSIRGMIHKIKHMVEVEGNEGAPIVDARTLGTQKLKENSNEPA